MRPNQHLSDEELVEVVFGDSNDLDRLHTHLDACAACAARRESIAETLRLVTGDPIPLVDAGRSWRALRPRLQPRVPHRKRFNLHAWSRLALAAGLAIAVVSALGLWQFQRSHTDSSREATGQTSQPLHNVPQPPNPDVQIAGAERLLTSLSHLSGPIDEEARAQAHSLLLDNPVTVHGARSQGEDGEALVLENVGHLLTSVEAAPPTAQSTIELQTEWNIPGLLLQLRILQQDRLAALPQAVEEYQ